MSKKIFVWGNYDGNDRVLTIKECLKEQTETIKSYQRKTARIHCNRRQIRE